MKSEHFEALNHLHVFEDRQRQSFVLHTRDWRPFLSVFSSGCQNCCTVIHPSCLMSFVWLDCESKKRVAHMSLKHASRTLVDSSADECRGLDELMAGSCGAEGERGEQEQVTHQQDKSPAELQDEIHILDIFLKRYIFQTFSRT